jgi:hypothetical protein
MNEFANQLARYDNEHCRGVKFYAEKTTPIAATDTAVIIVSLWKADYSNKDVDYVDGVYRYVIDIVTNAKSTTDERGDALAAYRLQKLMGLVRYILEHSLYCTLSFSAPFILHTEVEKFQILKFDKEDAPADTSNTSQGQIIFLVRCGETTTPIDGTLLGESLTEVRLDETDEGYEYVLTAEE